MLKQDIIKILKSNNVLAYDWPKAGKLTILMFDRVACNRYNIDINYKNLTLTELNMVLLDAIKR